ncbi:MAG: hypothetical protein ACYTBJ_20825 [Planctomycetota bacterium]|jgi:hypothetical protein
MRKYNLLVLLTIGFFSVGALAVSLNQRCPTLPQTEKANVIGGVLCHSCIDCRNPSNCMDPGVCPRTTCGAKVQSVDLKCVTTGLSIGGCAGGGARPCYQVKICFCIPPAPPVTSWACDPEPFWTTMPVWFYETPC